MNSLEKCIEGLFKDKRVDNLIVKVGLGDADIFDIKRSSCNRVLTDETLFDMASVTKIVVTTSLSLIAIEKGLLSTDDNVDRFFAVPRDKKEMKVLHLLTHTMGIGHKSVVVSGKAYADIQDYILSIPSDFPIGRGQSYSCPGFILLGRILEEIFERRLDQAFLELVAEPLGLKNSRFLPDRTLDAVNSNVKESECGMVNDYNCRYLGGVSGNAGLFSNLADMTSYAKALLGGISQICSKQVFERAITDYTPTMNESRALGFVFVDGRYQQTGGLFSHGSIGHCGHTGQSVFVDPSSGLYTVILSDATVNNVRRGGRENYEDVKKMRCEIHTAIKKELNI